MDLELLQKLFLAIKEDDLEYFSETVRARRSAMNISFGRFPILSCCYLFDSEKIIAAYERELISVTAYNRVIEFSEIYLLFKAAAKKCLRFYMEENSVVSPMEMLAVLNDAIRLKKVFARYQKSELIASRIADIYDILHKQKIKRQENILSIKKPKLSVKKIWSITAIIVLALFSTGLFFGGYIYAVQKFGDGSEEKPIIIRSYNQFRLAMEKGKMYYTLEADISITDSFDTVDFEGYIDGQGHTINIEAPLNSSIIGTLNGSIENLNINISDQDLILEQDRSFFVGTNNGQINNVYLEVKASVSESIAETDINLSALCLQNEGSITDCKIKAQIDFISDGAKDTFLSGFVITNNGVINRCELTEGSKFISDTVDLSGIAVTNGEKGEINNCKNYAEITQNSGLDAWHPHCGGIVLTNLGLISNSYNYGKISVSSENESGEYDMYAGGIVAVNKSKVSKSKNLGEIVAIGKNNEIYIGGICGINDATSAVIEACGNGGKYKILSPSTASYMFGGGIVGGNVGTIKDCFSYGAAEADNNSIFLCTIAGYVNYQYTRINNNVAVNNENAPYFAITIYYNPLIVADGCQGVETFEELKETGVYWE
ncbi:hypothetical protein EOM82_00225 [bacterium]|nr:hypothetical protein [bacterium]